MNTASNSEPKSRTAAVWLASGLGVGLVMPAPGTFGALWGIGLLWLYELLPNAACWWTAALAVIAVGVPISARAARDLGLKDPGPVVWDEFATVPLVFAFVEPSWSWTMALAFVLHRVFDIAKLWPCNRLESLPGGWGIMLDDVMAALYAAAVLWAADYLFSLSA